MIGYSSLVLVPVAPAARAVAIGLGTEGAHGRDTTSFSSNHLEEKTSYTKKQKIVRIILTCLPFLAGIYRIS